jgi:damage-control phosphatase, subfamily I
MNLYFDCIPCILRQSLDAARLVTPDTSLHEAILRETLFACAQTGYDQPPPMLAARVHRRLRALSGVDDPYLEIRREQNRMALALLPELEARVAAAKDPFRLSVALAIAGNIIDLGVKGDVTKSDIRESIEAALENEITGNFDEFHTAVQRAERILYLADNAGEIVFDRLLLERLPRDRVMMAVRGAPVINDVILSDAEQCGLDSLVRVVSNGSDAPGTVLSECSAEFRELFDSADLIIAKGQGNFETLSGVDAQVYFLFKVKCRLVAEHTALPLGAHVLLRSQERP